jgi:putative Ca2+/H+ antiporter (TMEM165/GDT1 family)
MISDFLAALGVVFLAELPDKTMFATLLLATRFQRKSAVWCGVTTAYSMHVVVATLLGGLLSRLPEDPVRNVVGVLFVLAGVFVAWDSWRKDELDAQATTETPRSWRSVYAVSAATVGLAEFADITQLATASLAATRDSPWAVGAGAASALALVSGLAVLVGSALTRRLNLKLIQRAAGILFVLIGAATFI